MQAMQDVKPIQLQYTQEDEEVDCKLNSQVLKNDKYWIDLFWSAEGYHYQCSKGGGIDLIQVVH